MESLGVVALLLLLSSKGSCLFFKWPGCNYGE